MARKLIQSLVQDIFISWILFLSIVLLMLEINSPYWLKSDLFQAVFQISFFLTMPISIAAFIFHDFSLGKKSLVALLVALWLIIIFSIVSFLPFNVACEGSGCEAAPFYVTFIGIWFLLCSVVMGLVNFIVRFIKKKEI